MSTDCEGIVVKITDVKVATVQYNCFHHEAMEREREREREERERERERERGRERELGGKQEDNRWLSVAGPYTSPWRKT